MGGYTNGNYPLDLMIKVGPQQYLPPGTTLRWAWLVRQAWRKYGVHLVITAGWNAYRPYSVQVEYRKKYGIYAAYPGYSSHGLIYLGKEVAAIDVHNWAELGWARFSALCRLAGFTVDFVRPQELWHIGDFNDIWAVPDLAGEIEVTPAPPTPYYKKPYGINQKEKNMLAVRINDGLGKLGPRGKIRTYTVGPGLFIDTTDQDGADQASIIINGYNAQGQVQETPNLSYRALYDWAKQALSPAELIPYANAAGVA